MAYPPIRDQGWGDQVSQVLDAYNQQYAGYGGGSNPNYYGGGGGYGYGGGGGYDMVNLLGSSLMGNQLGSYLNFGNNLQGAMGQMQNINQGNQQAKLYNNALNSQLGQANILGNSNIMQALINAQGNIGVQREANNVMNNPLWQEQMRGNLGTSVADAQGRNALALLQAKGGIAKDLLGGLGGLFGGVGGNAASILQGFSNADGSQQASLGGGAPAPAGNPAAQPAATQQAQPGALQPYLQQISARGGQSQQPWREYLQSYQAQRRMS